MHRASVAFFRGSYSVGRTAAAATAIETTKNAITKMIPFIFSDEKACTNGNAQNAVGPLRGSGPRSQSGNRLLEN